MYRKFIVSSLPLLVVACASLQRPGTVKASTDAPQADAIPWLLLVTKSVGSQGSFSNITSIQRVNTVGGVAPKTGCSQSSVGTNTRIPYAADYYLLTEK